MKLGNLMYLVICGVCVFGYFEDLCKWLVWICSRKRKLLSGTIVTGNAIIYQENNDLPSLKNRIITKSNRTRGPSKPNKEKKTKKSKKTKEMLVVPFNFEEFVKAETKKLRDEELYYTKEYHNQTYAKKVSDHFTKELNSMNNEELVKEFTTLFPYCSDHEEDKRLTSLKEQIDILGIKVSGDELKVIEMLFITPPDEIFVCANKEFVIDEKLVKERYDIRNENVIKLLSVDGWLNDEVINAYILLLKARNHEGRNYHFVSSFYYEKTGSGKSYTMGTDYSGKEKSCGIIPKLIDTLFSKVEEMKFTIEFTIKMSFVEMEQKKSTIKSCSNAKVRGRTPPKSGHRSWTTGLMA